MNLRILLSRATCALAIVAFAIQPVIGGAASSATSDTRLIGVWHEGYGDNHVLFEFRSDGRFQRYVRVTGLMAAEAWLKGKYQLSSGVLTLHGTLESFKPSTQGRPRGYTDRPTNIIERYRIVFVSSYQMEMRDLQTGYEASLTRVRGD